jgi:hypothetical protein
VFSDLIQVAVTRNYISNKEKEELIKWHANPKKYWISI